MRSKEPVATFYLSEYVGDPAVNGHARTFCATFQDEEAASKSPLVVRLASQFPRAEAAILLRELANDLDHLQPAPRIESATPSDFWGGSE